MRPLARSSSLSKQNDWNCMACWRSVRQSSLLSFRSPNRFHLRFPQAVRENTVVRDYKTYHSSHILQNSASANAQAVPLGDFYTDLLAKPIPKTSQAQRSLPTFVQSGDKQKEERAKLLFGTIEGSGYERRTYERPDATWRTINGVPVPPKPAEPENCCMSGCVHCVWDDYRDDVEGWAARIHEAQSKGYSREGGGSPKIQLARSEVSEASTSMDDDGGGSESLWTTPSTDHSEEDLLFQGIPIGIREFMATEKRIRERKRRKKEKTQ